MPFLREAQQMAESDRSRQFFHRHHIGQFAHFISRFFQQLPLLFRGVGFIDRNAPCCALNVGSRWQRYFHLTVAQNCILLAGKRDFIEIQRIAVNLIAGHRLQNKAHLFFTRDKPIQLAFNGHRNVTLLSHFCRLTPADLHILRR